MNPPLTPEEIATALTVKPGEWHVEPHFVVRGEVTRVVVTTNGRAYQVPRPDYRPGEQTGAMSCRALRLCEVGRPRRA